VAVTWRTLKAIGGSRTVALASFFPFIGYLLVANEEFQVALRLVTDQIDSNAMINRLRQIYFAMLYLSGGVILYRLFCPSAISEFKDRYEYLEKEIATVTPSKVGALQNVLKKPSSIDSALRNSYLSEEIRRVSELKFDDGSIKEIGFPVGSRSNLKTLPAYQSESGIPLVQLIEAMYDYQNTKNAIIRSITSILFALGYGKLAWPSIVVAYQLLSF
jgi:hypothetical protein